MFSRASPAFETFFDLHSLSTYKRVCTSPRFKFTVFICEAHVFEITLIYAVEEIVLFIHYNRVFYPKRNLSRIIVLDYF